MKLVARCLLAAFLLLPVARAAESAELTDMRAADQQRLNATISGDVSTLANLLSDELTYAHSDGRVQTKRQFLDAVAGNRIKYLSIVPVGVEAHAIDADAATLQGGARLVVVADGRRREFTLRFLAVWRREAGQWRLLAYQSSQLGEAR